MGNMTLYRLVLWNCLVITWATQQNCLTGTMTDVQSWVDQDGHLIEKDSGSSLDVSGSSQAVTVLQEHLQLMTRRSEEVKFVSLARCRFREVPEVFTVPDAVDRLLSETVEYLTLYGNLFDDHQSTSDRYDSFINATQARTIAHGLGYDTRAAAWPLGFIGVRFEALRELDLRSCAITTLGGGVFKGMPTLEALYLSDNNILFINAKAFTGLSNLLHLDLSKNYDFDEFGNHKTLLVESVDVMEDLENLMSLDFSYTRLSQANLLMFSNLGKNFQRLSLCETGLTKLRENLFANTSLRYLDISGNNGILNRYNALAGTEKSLEVLYAVKIGLVSLSVFQKFKRLEILNVQWNEISMITADVTATLESLQVLDLDGNRISSWFHPVFQVMPSLKYLSIRNNNINMLNEVMMEDLENINYLAIAGNFVICNCYAREFFNLALKAEQEYNDTVIETAYERRGSNFSTFHTGFQKYNEVITNRVNVSEACLADKYCNEETYDNETFSGFLLTDYDPLVYQCMHVVEAKKVSLSSVVNCNSTLRDIDYGDVIKDSRNKLVALVVVPVILFAMLTFVFWYRKNFRYFCITIRNSALLSMINSDKVIDDSRIFNYDVFVSYCNDDRGWILDQLLPHLETNCGVSVCLHERDFQVGLSILENIVSCMDRSRSIMLIISREFLLSQWCQFEMHLAQHRLLETRREDLILVLLEEIPRHLRPTTLHYLMLTKTYIVYPSEGADSMKKEFWKRLGRSVTARRPENENDSLA